MFVKGTPRISICLIGAILTLVVAFCLTSFLIVRMNRAEIDQVVKYNQNFLSEKLNKSIDLLELEKKELATLTRSLALSDDLVLHIGENRNSEWLKSHFVPVLSRKGRYDTLNTLLIFTENEIDFSHSPIEGYDRAEQLIANSMVQGAFAGETSSSFVLASGSVYTISVAPITSIYDQSNVKGVLLTGKRINNEILTWMTNLLDVDLALVTPTQVEYPISRKYILTPPLFAESLKAGRLEQLFKFDQFLTRAKILSSTSGDELGVLWIISPVIKGASRSWINTLDSRQSLYFALGFSLLLSALTYIFLYFLVRRPIRRALYRMASEPLAVDHGNLENAIDEITSVKKAVRRLQKVVVQNKEVRNIILNSINEGFQLIDLNNNTVEVNAALCSLAGISREKFLAESNPFFYLNEEGRDLAFEFVELVRKGEINLRRGFESELNWSDGQNSKIKVRLCSVEDENSIDGHVCIFVDSRDSKLDMQFNIHELGKMTMLVKFAGSIAHNMNNILTGILSAVSLIERGSITPETSQQLVKSIREAINKGSSLCTELLQMSKVRQVRNSRRPMDIVPIVKDVVRMAEQLHEAKQHQINIEMPEGPIMALCDDSGFHHVLLNLVLNSFDAMTKPGMIDINVEIFEAPEAMVKLIVKDSGIGMSPDVQKRIFDPFFSTKQGSRTRKKTFGGTGLGLASALETVQSWGGGIDCFSEPEEGTTFTITLQGTSNSTVSLDMNSSGSDRSAGDSLNKN